MKKVICLVGPTASGKTSLSINLAKKLNGEIISADSMQIYRNLDIGTAKITDEEKEGITHHLIDIVDMQQEFSVADFKSLCYNKIEEIIKKNKTPIIVGGTGLYMSAVIQDMDFKEENVNEEYRNKLYSLAKEKGNLYIHELLEKVDKASAMQIHPNNLKRVIRALEMYENNNTKSIHMEKEKLKENSKYDFKLFCLNIDKDILHERINKRVDIMFNQGLEKEAKMVYNLKQATAKQAIGYKEFFEYFENKITLEEVKELIKLRTRQYSKRQITWFKKMKDVMYLDVKKTKEELVKEIMEKYYE